MKVGILSMQRIANYGSFLQAYALRKLISELGHEVVFKDYRPGKPVEDDGSAPTKHESGLKLRLKLLIKKLTGREIYFSERYQLMLSELGISSRMNYDEKTDTLVIGSDEVFNCLQSNPDVGFSPQLFGQDANANRLISYAASFGFTTTEGLEKAHRFEEVSKYLKNFDALSVRDENSAKTLTEMGITDFSMHLDPVLIYGFQKEIKEKKDISDYIIVYSYAGRINREEEIEKIKEFARSRNKKIVTVGFHQPWSDIKLEAKPFELLGYFKNADFVVTDTFHGTIFSIITKKRFATIIRSSNKQKLTSLLKDLELESRIVGDIADLESCILPQIDYEKTNDIIAHRRMLSMEYLKNNI